ncbi:MAG: ABC transporter permease [Cyclobacteriaceae bacterium]|nr:ABC transporter permease [Cyclobacteriaceae bacterium]MCH8515957.1 ABC transporter permease [Cyclobacteriaceae bacterium]
MIIIENVKEGLISIRSNKLRTFLTALIIAIGITALVGILTAIDGIQATINTNFAGLGVNTFQIKNQDAIQGRRVDGKIEKDNPPITLREAQGFSQKFIYEEVVSVSGTMSGSVVAKRGSKVTNPNTRVVAANEHYLEVESLDLSIGRNFSVQDLAMGNKVVVIGDELKRTLFDAEEEVINRTIRLYGDNYRVIGVLEKQGGIGGGGSVDRIALIPLLNIKRANTPNLNIVVQVSDPSQSERLMGEATRIMREVRRDEMGAKDSFFISKKESAADRLNEITGYLKIGGFSIGFITLLGASIGLMNIMLVSVTERTREIGVRKALGATPSLIRQQFLVEAIVICQLGGIGGILLGIGMGNAVSNIINPGSFVVPVVWMVVAVVVCIFVGMISGYYPAYKASKLDPIESLRFE